MRTEQRRKIFVFIKPAQGEAEISAQTGNGLGGREVPSSLMFAPSATNMPQPGLPEAWSGSVPINSQDLFGIVHRPGFQPAQKALTQQKAAFFRRNADRDILHDQIADFQ